MAVSACTRRAVLTLISMATFLPSKAVHILQPPPGGSFDFVPEIPLWISLGDRADGQCFEIFLDGESMTILCDPDTVLSGTVPAPGEHRIEVYATFLPASSGIQASSTFTVTNNDPIPKHLSEDGVTIKVPEFVHQYHKWWHNNNVWNVATRWMDVSALKQPMDLWNYQEVIYEIKPSLLVEIGTMYGGGTVYFDTVMQRMHEETGSAYRLLSVDIQHDIVPDKVRQRPNVELLEAPSASLRVQSRVRELRAAYPGPMFMILDADHGADNVTLELQMMTPLMVEGDYLIVEDTNLDGHPGAVAPGWGPCPYDAIIEFMAMNRGLFRREVERELKFGFSQSYAGFLRRTASKQSIVMPLSHNPYLNA